MGPLIALVLVCAASMPAQDCTRDTALDVLVLPGVPTPMACAMGGWATLARGADTHAGTYPKVRCEHRKG